MTSRSDLPGSGREPEVRQILMNALAQAIPFLYHQAASNYGAGRYKCAGPGEDCCPLCTAVAALKESGWKEEID